MKKFSVILPSVLGCISLVFSSCETTKNLNSQEQPSTPQVLEAPELNSEPDSEQIFDFEGAESVSDNEAGWMEELKEDSPDAQTDSENLSKELKEEIVIEAEIDQSKIKQAKIKQDVKDPLKELETDINFSGTNNDTSTAAVNNGSQNDALSPSGAKDSTSQNINSQAETVTSQFENQKSETINSSEQNIDNLQKDSDSIVSDSTVNADNLNNQSGLMESDSDISNLIDEKERTENSITAEKNDTEIQGQEIEPGKTTAKSSIVAKDTVVPSRSMEMLLNQYIDIEYPGSGWVYLGETEEVNLVKYFGRKMNTSKKNDRTTTFQLRSFKPGKTILHFYKNDLLNDTYIDDYIAITVTETVCKDNAHAKAPDYSEIVPEKVELYQNQEIKESTVIAENERPAVPEVQKSKQTAKNIRPTENIPGYIPSFSSASTGAPVTVEGMEDEMEVSLVTPQAESPNLSESLLDKAQECYDNFEFERALDYVQNFLDHSLTDLDQGFFLKGKILEAKSPVQNIREALNCYDTVVKNYPQSEVWESSNEKVIYIKRFYFNYR